MKNTLNTISVIEPIVVKVRKSRKVILFIEGVSRPKVIHITGMTTPEIQSTFKLGCKHGSDKTIKALTIE